MSDPSFPAALPTDNEDVSWALSTGQACWARGDKADAVKWVKRASDSAADAGDDDRAFALARVAADLKQAAGIGSTVAPPAAPPPPAPAATPAPPAVATPIPASAASTPIPSGTATPIPAPAPTKPSTVSPPPPARGSGTQPVPPTRPAAAVPMPRATPTTSRPATTPPTAARPQTAAPPKPGTTPPPATKATESTKGATPRPVGPATRASEVQRSAKPSEPPDEPSLVTVPFPDDPGFADVHDRVTIVGQLPHLPDRPPPVRGKMDTPTDLVMRAPVQDLDGPTMATAPAVPASLGSFEIWATPAAGGGVRVSLRRGPRPEGALDAVIVVADRAALEALLLG